MDQTITLEEFNSRQLNSAERPEPRGRNLFVRENSNSILHSAVGASISTWQQISFNGRAFNGIVLIAGIN